MYLVRDTFMSCGQNLIIILAQILSGDSWYAMHNEYYELQEHLYCRSSYEL
jgi:hypothetical protein